jgi:hypothetical protein
MVAVRAAAGHVQREIDLRRREPRHALRRHIAKRQMSLGIVSCMPG